jgi:hypothetical protein
MNEPFMRKVILRAFWVNGTLRVHSPYPKTLALRLRRVNKSSPANPRMGRAPRLHWGPNRSRYIPNTSSTYPRPPNTRPSLKYRTRHRKYAPQGLTSPSTNSLLKRSSHHVPLRRLPFISVKRLSLARKERGPAGGRRGLLVVFLQGFYRVTVLFERSDG